MLLLLALNLPVIRGVLEIPRLLFTLKAISFPVEGAVVCHNARGLEGTLREHEQQLLRVFKEVRNSPRVWLYVHGSWADNKRTSFSDLDDLVIVDLSGATLVDIVRISWQLWLSDRRMRIIDPLQHHGHWIISAEALNGADAGYIPLQVVEGALVLSGPKKLRARQNQAKSLETLQRNISVSVSEILIWLRKLENQSLRLYELKRMCSALALLPAYVFQSQGLRLTKVEAIEKTKEISEPLKETLEWTWEVREAWNQLQTFKETLLLPWIARLPLSGPHYRRFAAALSSKALLPRELEPKIGHIEAFLAWAQEEIRVGKW